jgi:hypothetical protein
MTASSFTVSVVEDAALAWLEAPGYVVLHRLAIATYGLRIGRSARFVPEVAE